MKLYKSSSGLYCIDGGQRRKVIDMKDFHSWGLDTGEIEGISEEELRTFPRGGSVPFHWGLDTWLAPPVRDNKRKMREISVSQIKGNGVEFGAGSRPLPVPLGVNIKYMDPFDMSIQGERMFSGAETHDFVDSTQDSIEEMKTIQEGSLDFIVAAHVIEHTKNPLKVLELSYNKLKEGGQLVLIIPDKEVTFDKVRPLTSLEHIIQDYENPSSERDLEHYIEFLSLVHGEENPSQKAKDMMEEGLDVHFHTWTLESFYLMARYSQEKLKWDSMWWHERVNAHHALEFYFSFTK